MRITLIGSIVAELYFSRPVFLRVLLKTRMRSSMPFSNNIWTRRLSFGRWTPRAWAIIVSTTCLDDLSPQARKTWVEHARKTLEELPKQTDYQKLSRDGKIDYAILQLHLMSYIWNEENMRPFELDPRIYNAYINESVYIPLTQSTLPTETNISNCIARMKLIPEVVAEAKRSLQNPPAVVTETAIKQNLGRDRFLRAGYFSISRRNAADRRPKGGRPAAGGNLKAIPAISGKRSVAARPRRMAVGQGKVRQKIGA